MAEQISASSIAAPGFLGINSQDSPTQLDSGFAAQAYNCVIDRYGRIGARKGWSKVNATNADLGTANVQFIFEMTEAGGNKLLSAGNNKLFTGTSTLTRMMVRNQPNTADLAYTITADNWQGAAILYGEGSDAKSHAYLAQAAHELLVYHELPVSGSGATFNTTVTTGAITSITVNAAGSGYNVGDVLTISGGGGNATVTVATLSGTGVATVTITTGGTGYSNGTGVASTVTTNANPHGHGGSFGFQRVGDVGSLPPGYTTTEFKPNCALAAYGRIWVADISGDRQTIYFSRLLDGSDFRGGDSGSLGLNSVFPNNDKVVALAAHNGFLIVFGQKNIAIYANPIDVTALTLSEFIPNVGCIARDSIVSTGTDLLFLSDSGIRSLGRVIQEKSLPFRDVSKNVRDEFTQKVTSETNKDNIKAIYSEINAFYLVALPTVKEVYCFDMRNFLQDGSSRVTVWNKIEPRSFCIDSNKDLLIGKAGYIGKYGTYLDDTATYRLQYYTPYFDLGLTTVEKILKKTDWIIIGGPNQNIAIKWAFDYSDAYRSNTMTISSASVAEYNIAQYNIDEYVSGIVIAKIASQLGGAGTAMQLGLETEINQSQFSIQKINVFAKPGKNV